MNPNDLSLLIIAGGKSSRLGRDKRKLKLGELPLLESTLCQGRKANFSEIFLCAEAEEVPTFGVGGGIRCYPAS